jgi:hypothetical protein
MPRNPMMSLAASASAWWMGHAANAMRRGQTAWIAAVARAAVPDQPKPPAKPKRRKAR